MKEKEGETGQLLFFSLKLFDEHSIAFKKIILMVFKIFPAGISYPSPLNFFTVLSILFSNHSQSPSIPFAQCIDLVLKVFWDHLVSHSRFGWSGRINYKLREYHVR
ncbi:unnamed protein product [Meloidogyne enterolobii]|uniref:Uncharacterized protein n=1 Tax=Meloidogyne enterolobii TaxID=390850 RepID=A0ACB0XMQ9_MELEN